MDINKAMNLKSADDLLKAAKEAEARNCEADIIRKLYQMYYKAAEREAE